MDIVRRAAAASGSRSRGPVRSAGRSLRWGAAAVLAGLAVLAPLRAQDQSDSRKGPTVTKAPFGKTPDGAAASLFTLTNASGARVTLTDYGARIVKVEVPDRSGKLADVTLGFDRLDKYVAHTAHFGCTTGRFGNRIARGRFTLDGKEYELATNNGPNHLHGGVKGIDRYVWKAEELREPHRAGVRFTHRSPDGDEGYPGNLDMTVTISWSDENALAIGYLAVTDKPTVLNLTNHAYWNLAGSGDVLGHKLELRSDRYLAVDGSLIPTGEQKPVSGTFMDFTSPQTIGSRIAETKFGTLPIGYDHCYVLRSTGNEPALAARVEDPQSGRVMEVLTTEPAVQFYTGNFLDGAALNGGHKQHAALCLETQHYPDSPNHPGFPTTVLRPGEKFQSTTIYRFGAK